MDDAAATFIPLIQQALDAYRANGVPGGSAVKTGLVNADLLNVRSGPGLDFPPVAQLQRDSQVVILETNNEWDRIGDNRWVYSDYIALDS